MMERILFVIALIVVFVATLLTQLGCVPECCSRFAYRWDELHGVYYLEQQR